MPQNEGAKVATYGLFLLPFPFLITKLPLQPGLHLHTTFLPIYKLWCRCLDLQLRYATNSTVKRIFREHQIFAILLKYTQIFGIAHHHDFVCIEYQLFRDIMCNIFGII